MFKLLAVWLLLLFGIVCISQSEAFWHGTAAGPPPPPSGTVPQDASGWYTWASGVGPNGFCEGEGCTADPLVTQVVYVDPACGGSCGSGTFANPVASPVTVPPHMRDGSPDWMLIKKGSVFTDDAPGSWPNKGGLDCAHPFLYSSYDPAIYNALTVPIPNPYSGGARPKFNLSSVFAINDGAAFGFANKNYVAISGLDFEDPTRDPASGSFLRSESQLGGADGGSVSFVSCFYLEDIKASGTGTVNLNPYTPDNNIFLHRVQIAGGYPNANTPDSGILTALVGNGPADFVIDGSIIDHNGFNTDTFAADGGGVIAWSPPSGFNHNLYLNGTGNNGDPGGAFSGSRATVKDSLISRDAGGEQFRGGGLITGNLGILTDELVTYFVPYSTAGNVISGNINIDPYSFDPGVGISSMEIGNPYINENVIFGGVTVTNNISSASVFNPSGDGIDIGPGVNGATATGNIFFNWAVGGTVLGSTTGSLYGGSTGLLTVSVPGTGYTDFSSTFGSTMAWDGSNCGSNGSPSNNIEVIFNSQVTFGNSGVAGQTTVWLEGGGQTTGVYQACVYGDGFHAVIWNTNFSGSASGTIYWPYYGAVPTNISGSGSGGKMDLMIAHGSVVAASILGSDGMPAPLSDKGIPRGTGYAQGDVLAIQPGNFCQGGGCPGTAFPAHSSGTAMQITVPAIGVNTVGTDGCNLATQNDLSDNTGTNVCSFSDPGRTPASYYATGGSLGFGSGTWTPVASSTFTGVVSSGVLTVTSQTGAINLGDAITWGSQTKQDYIKFNKGGVISALGTLTASACAMSPYVGCHGVLGTLGSRSTSTCSASPAGCSTGTYTNVPLFNVNRWTANANNGSNATANITVVGTTITVLTYNAGSGDSNYAVGDILSVDPTTIGGVSGGTTFTIPVASNVAVSGAHTYTGVRLLGGHGLGATASVTVTGGTVTGITITNGGIQYLDTDVLYPNSFDIGGYTDAINGANAYYGNPNTSIVISTFAAAGANNCNGSPCIGTGSNSGGTYALTGLNTSVTSRSMSSWTQLQLIQLLTGNNKSIVGSAPGWKTSQTVPCVNSYINQGFGITSACP